MTDEQIIALAKKTREKKFCPQYRERLYEHLDDIYDCSCRCPVSYADEFDIQCGDTIYEQGFLDGFKAAIEFVKSKVSDVRKEYEDTDDFTYEAGGKDALNDLLEAIER